MAARRGRGVRRTLGTSYVEERASALRRKRISFPVLLSDTVKIDVPQILEGKFSELRQFLLARLYFL